MDRRNFLKGIGAGIALIGITPSGYSKILEDPKRKATWKVVAVANESCKGLHELEIAWIDKETKKEVIVTSNVEISFNSKGGAKVIGQIYDDTDHVFARLFGKNPDRPKIAIHLI